MYTSGTTGDPKGVMISNESLLVNIAGPDSVLQYIGEVVSRISNFLYERTHVHLHRAHVGCSPLSYCS
jgi:acyl-coenzyme A synthetase/AMP-(fatty) acid ligase